MVKKRRTVSGMFYVERPRWRDDALAGWVFGFAWMAAFLVIAILWILAA